MIIGHLLRRTRVIAQVISKGITSKKVEGIRISKYQRLFYSREMASPCTTDIVKSLNDKREYRLLFLENGLRALLISDLDGEDQSSVDDGNQSESDDESAGSDNSEDEGSDMEVDDMSDSENDLGQEKKSAAALCIGVGSFSDPDNIPGFAHFLEHMVFMGSEKYPEENALDDYLSKHGGYTNAWTDHERTCFYFEVEQDAFRKSLDKFAHFFVGPLLLQDSVDREIEAVDSEFQETVSSDSDRLHHILIATAKHGNPMSKFLLGNLKSLKTTPAEKGIDVYGQLRDFFNKYYTAQYMTLAVHSKHSLDTLEAWVRESFSGIHNNKEAPVSFTKFKDPFDTDGFRKLFKGSIHAESLYYSRTKPIEYISNLLNYEGEGSIYSYLKKRMWAVELLGGNTGEGYDMNQIWTGLDICITLTDEGLKHWSEVVKVIFQYLDLMQREGPQESFYNELKVIEETKFRWKEKGDPAEYVEKVSDNMQLYPSEDYLTGHKFLYKFDEKVINNCMEHLRADNCNVMLTSTNFTESDCPLKEHWFGTHYSVEDIPKEQLQSWTDFEQNCELFLPKENHFIATDFTLKDLPAEDLKPVPMMVSSSSQHKLFFKKDTKFNVPKGYIYMHLKSPVVCDNLKSSALFDLFIAILNQNISEPTYPAVVAGYKIGCMCDPVQTGMVVEVDGFNHKIQEVLLLTFDLIKNFSCADDLFHAMKAEVKKTYHNEIMKPSSAARVLRWIVTEKRYWSHADKYRIVDELTKPELMDLVNRFLKQIFLESLVIGNFTKQEALSINDEVLSKLKSQKPVDQKVLENNLIAIPQEKLYCQIKSFNPEDTMSCVHNYYQSQPGTLLKCCLNELLCTRMTEPCFNTLRTKQQLGYSVSCINHMTCGVIALGICVECKAQNFSMQYVDEQIEKFLLEMKDILQSMTQEEFETLIESEITLKRTEDTQLEEETSRHWREIVDQTYVFDRLEKEIAVLKTLSLKTLQDWFTDEYLGDKQRKISFQVIGCQENVVAMKHLSDTDHEIKCLIDPDQSLSTPIDDINSFKQSCKQLPHTKVIS
ncbi:nardilysin-like [Ruditapes philippinarum]|uniref:nardilysin-like n=1 Tax=Ruditapes philippinarum TaxID=129788 RepID=UPI00295A5F71|nr:nardilysin-like [Ruditapes philippinarum]